MKKICILPFVKEIIPLIINQPDNYMFSSIVSINKYDDGVDIAEFVNRIPTGNLITYDMKNSILNCDLVVIGDIEKKEILIEGKKYNPYREFIHSGIKMALDYKKDIICCTELSESEQKTYIEAAKKLGVQFKYLKFEKLSDEVSSKCKEMDVPVICIGEMLPECDGYEIFLKLIQRFHKDGIRAVGLSEDKYNALYNQIPLKFWNGSDPGTTIKLINNYVSDIEKNLCPDILLIKLPLPMTTYNDKLVFDYGAMAYIILKALKTDILVYCGLGGYWMPEFMDSIDMNFRAKFGVQISAFHFSNQLLDYTTEIEEGITTIHIPIGKVQQEIFHLRLRDEHPVYNLIDSEEFETFYNRLKRDTVDLTYGRI